LTFGLSSQARRRDFAAGGKNRMGSTFSIQYWMYAATGDPNMKWEAQILNEGPGTISPTLATALCQVQP